MTGLEELKNILSKYEEEDIIITHHAEEQAIFRKINIEEVKGNILNPVKLSYAEEQKAKNRKERKFNCYFDYGKYHAHRYVLVTNSNCIVCTIIDVRKDWQRIIEKGK